MESYLTNRYQYTKIGDSKSSQQQINCSIAQGSSLGPFSFLLYVNDLPLVSQFSTTLFADDTLLALSDANLSRLENGVNTQLRHIDHWLIHNKLSLNYSKTMYLLFNKQPNVPISSKFSLFISRKEIFKSDSVKYLGVWFDDKLNWFTHTQKLSLQLARCSNMLYHIHDFVNDQTLVMVYYGFAYSRLTYGITAWGTEVKLNNIVHTLTWNTKFSHVTKLYKKLDFLKLHFTAFLYLHHRLATLEY